MRQFVKSAVETNGGFRHMENKQSQGCREKWVSVLRTKDGGCANLAAILGVWSICENIWRGSQRWRDFCFTTYGIITPPYATTCNASSCCALELCKI